MKVNFRLINCARFDVFCSEYVECSWMLRHMATVAILLAFLRSVLRLLVISNVVKKLQTLVTLKMKAIHSSDTSYLTRATQRNIPENGILINLVIVFRQCHMMLQYFHNFSYENRLKIDIMA
jgi:hypothetical protein